MLLCMDKDAQRQYFILFIWPQATDSPRGTWRGYLESASGSRTYFASLEQLGDMLRSIGWQGETAVSKPEHPQT